MRPSADFFLKMYGIDKGIINASNLWAFGQTEGLFKTMPCLTFRRKFHGVKHHDKDFYHFTPNELKELCLLLDAFVARIESAKLHALSELGEYQENGKLKPYFNKCNFVSALSDY